MVIRALTAEDVDAYRTIRLEALQADPAAFGSNYERELAFGPQDWLDRVIGRDGHPSIVWLDEVDGCGRGIVTLAYTEARSDPQIFAMWVRESARGGGVADRLLETAVAHARSSGARQVVLAVKRDNPAAISLYGRHGFVATGSVDVADDPCCAGELEMRRTL